MAKFNKKYKNEGKSNEEDYLQELKRKKNAENVPDDIFENFIKEFVNYPHTPIEYNVKKYMSEFYKKDMLKDGVSKRDNTRVYLNKR